MEGLSQNEKIIWSCWEEKSPRDVVREAAAKGTHIKLALKYLEHRNGWSESTAKEWFQAEVSAWIVQLLMRKQIFKVLHILNKVEINPEQHLIALARETVEIAFRDFIVNHLEANYNDFKPENMEKWRDFYKHWNLLRYLEKSFESDDESCSTMSKREFYIELAKFCVTHKLYKVMAFCIEGDVVEGDLGDIDEDIKNCIELWLLFKSIEQTSDKQSHVIPIYKTCQQIAYNNIDNYISENPHLVLGMILLDDHAKLFDIFKQDEYLQFKDFRLPNKCGKDKLLHLQNVYKKFTDLGKFTNYKDVNVYQLLAGYHGLDVSKLFEFQMTHKNINNALTEKPDRRSLGSLLSQNVEIGNVQALPQKSSDIPHFANEKLMKRYGYVAKLNHMYYLKQYRPCNASQAFVMQQYQMYNRLQDKGIKSACCEAHALALQHWNDPALTACCVSFIAMIGCNPTRARVHISAAQIMKKHMIQAKGLSEEAAIKCVNEYMTNISLSNNETAKEMLNYLEEITIYNIKKKQEIENKFDISLILYETQTVVKFAMLHNLPLPQKQLKEFVKNSSWFNFLLFGDVFRYPVSQMLELSQKFENLCYAEHLKHIILQKNVEELSSPDKEHKSITNGQRRVCRLNSAEISPTGNVSFEFGEWARDLWEVAAACHGPEDPPAALVRAARSHREPLFALIATCYEPNAVSVLWAYWVVSAIGVQNESFHCDMGTQLADDQMQKVAELCLEMGHVRTLHESMLIFFPIAKLAGLPVNNILIAEWTHKYDEMLLKEDSVVEEKDVTLFIAQCSEAFKKASVTFSDAVNFLLSHIADMSESIQKFYSYKIVLSWFEENYEYGSTREGIEHLMWDSYFKSDQQKIFLNSYHSILHFLLSGQKDYNVAKKMGQLNSEKPFSMQLEEIEIQSDILNIHNVVLLENEDIIEKWKSVLNYLLELKLMAEAFRLSALFKIPPEYKNRSPPCPVQVVRTCLKLAEGNCSPYELPQELRLVISSPLIQQKFSETSDTSYEELVVITERQEVVQDSSTHLAVREDADRLSALEALAARSSLTLIKQVASYYRISLQIGWNYTSVLKYQNNPVEFINYVSGRARMPLANLVFRTFNISSKQIAEYLCNEIVAAVISPHLVKTSSFRQKEHFQYTLWGYPLNSDIEMFLNMRPDACSHIGRLMLDHLVAFRKIYKCNMSSKPSEDIHDDAVLDLDALIDEEYQNVEEDEMETLLSRTSEGGTANSAETESVFSVSTVYSCSTKLSKDTRRNLFDVISKSHLHIPHEVKSNIRKVTKGAKLSTKQVNIISIELLVIAHECFSCACDTEGVAVVLRSAQALASNLLAARSWRLMVRLLTGLARYTEMAYIFQALRDNHQFEFLLGQFDYMLGQQQDKITEFKQGLLDFLKNHCPSDTETYILVALHFNMYMEAADVKKKQAMNLLASLERIALDAAKATSKKPFQPPQWLIIHDNSTTRSMLETALNHCTDAAELYLQGGCMGFAGEMAGLAQQIALQISLLNASPTRLILNRSNEQVYSLVSEYLTFMEGLVLMVGRGGAQWRELAYRRALSNDQAYLRDMAAYRPDVAAEFLQRYKSEARTSSVSQAAMTELRNLCR
ncbi:Spatacsin [Eumeta japonica]|uniref:Spatacsin n=1 Tax=Eumeta variegata TaxID=151549 RepID=A0A4C1UE70_EUMVA|nr:Spatacsin [Eumeta japonica]